MRKVFTGLLTGLLLVLSIPGLAAGWEDLTAETAKSALSDVTLVHKDFKTYYDPDGSTLTGKWGGKTHNGTYSIKENGHYCAIWTTPGMEEEGCWSMKKKKKKLQLKPESGRANKGYTLKIKEGNKL